MNLEKWNMESPNRKLREQNYPPFLCVTFCNWPSVTEKHRSLKLKLQLEESVFEIEPFRTNVDSI